MRIKVRAGDDYTKLRDTPIDPDEARRALGHFIARSKQGRDIPEDLMEFILTGLERQLANDEGGWFRAEKKNRDEYLPADAWYCLNFDATFKRGDNGPATRKAQLAKIGMHLRKKQSALFKCFPEIDRSAYKDRFSENPIGKMVKEFSSSGFMRPDDTNSAEDAQFWNRLDAKTFCELRLDMKGEEAEKHAIEIVDKWNQQYGKGKK